MARTAVKRTGWLPVFALTLVYATQALRAQSACETQKLIGSEVTQADIFGVPIAISADTLVISAWRDDDNGANSGAAYVFRLDPQTSQWTEQQKLLSADGQPFDRFGFALAVADDTIMVGVPYDDHDPSLIDSGSVYVFRFDEESSQWIEEHKLIPDDVADMDAFGAQLALNGNVAIIGALLDDDNGMDSGSAYVYRYNGEEWIQEQKLQPKGGAAGDLFGFDVAMSDVIAVIGASQDDDRGTSAGAAYVFEYDGNSWVERQKLVASDGAGFDYFGRALAFDGEVILFGVRDATAGGGPGSAYVFRYDGQDWLEEQKLVPSDGADFDWFGDSVAISNDVAVIGSVLDDDNGTQSGSVYVYRYNGATWVESQKLLASDGHASHFFGAGLAVLDDTAFVGASGDTDQGIQAGAAYVFVGVAGIDCNTNAISDVCEILDGSSEDANGNGVPDECECPWDCANGDGYVGIEEFLAVLGTWGQVGVPCDLDGDGVGITDFRELLRTWGQCP